MNSMKSLLTLSAIAAASMLGGCSTQALIENSTKSTAQASEDASAQLKAASDKAKRLKAYTADTDVDAPYIAGAPVPLAREVTLPLALRKGVKTELMFKGSDRVDLMDAAAQLTLATGIPVRVRPDALLPQGDFLPRGAQVGNQASQPAAGGAAQPVTVNLRVSEAPAADILNYIAIQTGCYWEYKPEQGVIEIYRLVTKNFEFRGLSGTGSVTIGLGRMGGGGSAAASTFESNASTKFESKDIDSIKNLKASLDAMMTKGGSGSITDGGTIVVTDTKDSVDSIERFLKVENRRMNRRVRLVFEAIDVATNDTGERGVDWSLVYDKITQKLTGNVLGTLTMSSPQTVTSGNGGNLGFGIAGNSQFNGSKAIVDALRQIGTVVNVTSMPVMTLNRHPVQYAVRNTFDYVQSIQVNTVASSAGTTTAPQIQQSAETVGTSLTVTPAAFDDGQIVLNVAYDNTSLRSLLPYTAGGNSSSTNTVQQRNIDGTGTVQSLSMRSGQTLFISGIERKNESLSKSRLDDSIPLLAGGSDQAKKSKNTTIVLVTAVSEDGI